MWSVKPVPMPVPFFRGLAATVSVGYSLPPRRSYHRHIPTKSQRSESQSESGQKILLRSGESNPSKPTSKEKQMSGSDVLWAIQRAAAQRKTGERNKKKKGTGVGLASSAGESTGDNGVDYSNVRPLEIKSDWGHRLDDFEKLLKEFRHTEL